MNSKNSSKKYWNSYQGIKPLPDDRGYIPYELFDGTFPYIDNLAEMKVVLFITRRTTSFKKTEDWIAKCQFEDGITEHKTGEKLNPGAGLSRPSIDRGIKLAIQHNIIKERIACGRCGEKLVRANEERKRKDKTTGGVVVVTHHRVPKNCPNCGVGTQTRMKYFYQLTYTTNNPIADNPDTDSEWD